MNQSDYVLIINFLKKASDTGYTEIESGTQRLKGKAISLAKPCDVIHYYMDDNHIGTSHFMLNMNQLFSDLDKIKFQNAMAKVNKASAPEIIIRGHGNYSTGQISGIGGVAIGEFLIAMGLKNEKVKINVTGCKLARAPTKEKEDGSHEPFENSHITDVRKAQTDAAKAAEMMSARSFAADLHKHLIKSGNLRNCVLHARLHNVSIDENGRKSTRSLNDANQWVQKEKESKIVFRGDGKGGSSHTFYIP